MAQAGVGTIAIIVFLVAIVASTPIIPKIKETLKGKPTSVVRVAAVVGDVALWGIFFLSIVELAIGSYNPFIYFKF